MESRPTFEVNQVTVDTAGTPVTLPAINVGESCELVIKAKKNNTGAILVGHSTDAITNNPFTLEAKEKVKIRIGNASKVYIDAEVDGDGVEIITET